MIESDIVILNSYFNKFRRATETVWRVWIGHDGISGNDYKRNLDLRIFIKDQMIFLIIGQDARRTLGLPGHNHAWRSGTLYRKWNLGDPAWMDDLIEKAIALNPTIGVSNGVV